LHIASFAIQHVASTDLIMLILDALRPLRGKAPQRYLEVLAFASNREDLDSDTVVHIFYELNEILDDYGDVVRGYAWFLANAIIAYARLLKGHREYFDDEKVEDVVGGVADLLNELGRFKTSLGVIAWAHALAPALIHRDVRGLMEEKLGINVVNKFSEVLEELGKMRDEVQELMSDKEFMGYVESKSVKADEKAVKIVILEASSTLKHALAIYRLNNDKLKEVVRLFNEVAEEYREISEYENYLIDRGWALRVEAIKGSFVGEELVDGFRRLYEETFNVKRFKPMAKYLSTASLILGSYLVSLALTGDYETISKLREEHWQVLDANEQASVLTRLMLNALLGPRVGLSGELEDKLSINSWELIDAFRYEMKDGFQPALRVALGSAKLELEVTMCWSFLDSTKRRTCKHAISVATNDNVTVSRLRKQLINRFWRLLSKRLGLLKELGVDADVLFNEFRGLVNGLDGKSLVQLIAPTNSGAQLALMLHALINGNKELAKAHALYRAIYYSSKLLGRLFLEVYKECCDLGSESFRLAIAKLFFYHV